MQHRSRALYIASPFLVLFFVAALSVAMYNGLTHPFPGANDFYVPWRATQALVLEKRNPYGADVTRDIQIGLFGHVRTADEHQYAFAYPLPVSLLLAPLSLLPFDAAEAVWLSVCLIIIVAALFLVSTPARPQALTAYVLFGLFFYPAARSLVLGQFAIVAFGAVTLGMWSILRGPSLDWLAGVMFALATLKPQMVFLAVPVWLLWAVCERRWRLLKWFALSLAILGTLALIVLPSWPADFVVSLVAYDNYTSVSAPTAILFGDGSLYVIVDAILIASLAYFVWRQAQTGWTDFYAVAAFSLIVTQAVAPRTASTNQIILLIPIITWLRSRPNWQRTVLMLVLLIVPWLIFIVTLKGNEEQLTTYVFIPFACLVAGYYVLLNSERRTATRRQTG
jgi:Glycosyltransferase family 87